MEKLQSKMKEGDIVRMKIDRAKMFPRPSVIVNRVINGDPLTPGCDCIHIDLAERLEGRYVHSIDDLEVMEVI